jgi:hypothetical protein
MSGGGVSYVPVIPPITAEIVNTLVVSPYDEIDLTYDGSGNVSTVLYKSAGVLVATLSMTYTSGNLTSIVKT